MDDVPIKQGYDEIIGCLKIYFEKFDVCGETPYAISDNSCGPNQKV